MATPSYRGCRASDGQLPPSRSVQIQSFRVCFHGAVRYFTAEAQLTWPTLCGTGGEEWPRLVDASPANENEWRRITDAERPSAVTAPVALGGLVLGIALAQAAPLPPDVGPAIGERLLTFEARDQDGRLRTFSNLKGPAGLVLVFFRSADW